jgi:hypothetical protein
VTKFSNSKLAGFGFLIGFTVPTVLGLEQGVPATVTLNEVAAGLCAAALAVVYFGR